MPITCPQCSLQLPEVENLEYRFCPGCGAEISVEPQRLDEAPHTIPPDLSAQRPEQKSSVSDSKTDQHAIFTETFNDKTIAPQSMPKLQQPELKPPDTPPPASFYRSSPVSPVEKQHPPRSEEKVPPKPAMQKQSSARNRNIIIAGLIILALIILVLGGLFTF